MKQIFWCSVIYFYEERLPEDNPLGKYSSGAEFWTYITNLAIHGVHEYCYLMYQDGYRALKLAKKKFKYLTIDDDTHDATEDMLGNIE